MEKYDAAYWRGLASKGEYPEEFVKETEELSFASIPIPKEYGGSGLGLREASLVLEEINALGGSSQPFHGQYYLSYVFSKFASQLLKEKYLTQMTGGKLRMQAFALTEPEAGSDSTRIKTLAHKSGDHYVINGHKIFISRVKHSDLMVLVARTTPYEKVEKKVDGITLFLVDLRDAKGMDVHEIKTMINTQTCEVFIKDLKVPTENVIGEPDQGFRYLLRVLNPERILIAAECVGDARWFVEKSVDYAGRRVVFGKPIGTNQAIQFPIAQVYANLLAAETITWQAATMYDNGADEKELGKYANIAKYLAAECSTKAADAAMDIYGGYGMTTDMDIERKFKENRLYRIAPVSQNLVLGYIGHNVLGLPRSY